MKALTKANYADHKNVLSVQISLVPFHIVMNFVCFAISRLVLKISSILKIVLYLENWARYRKKFLTKYIGIDHINVWSVPVPLFPCSIPYRSNFPNLFGCRKRTKSLNFVTNSNSRNVLNFPIPVVFIVLFLTNV